MTPRLTPLDFALVNDWQRDFPLTERPYAELARHLGTSEAEVIERLQGLAGNSTISRIGAGSSAHAGLEHAGRRRGTGTPDRGGGTHHQRLSGSQPQLRARTCVQSLVFCRDRPKPRASFASACRNRPRSRKPVSNRHAGRFSYRPRLRLASGARFPHQEPVRRHQEPLTPPQLERADYALAAALDGGITLSPQPYAVLAARLGCSEDNVLSRIARLLKLGVIRCFGVVWCGIENWGIPPTPWWSGMCRKTAYPMLADNWPASQR